MTTHSHLANDDHTSLPQHTHLRAFESWAEHMSWHLDNPVDPHALDELEEL